MLPRTFLTQFTPARLTRAIERVQALIWRALPSTEIRVEQTPPSRGFLNAEELGTAKFTPTPPAPFHWGPKYSQRWFRVALPAETDATPRYFKWNGQGEATVYIDGKPYSGIDVAHPQIPLPAGTRELLLESVCIRSGIWLRAGLIPLDKQGSLYHPPELLARDDTAWSVYHDLKVLMELFDAEFHEYQPHHTGLPKPFVDPVRHNDPAFRASPLLRRLGDRIELALDVFDQEGIEAFSAELKKLYANFKAAPDSFRAILTGHAHIDLVWLWPENVGESKAVHSWSTQTRLLREYPEFRFGYSQPASYEAVGRRSPELLDDVKKLIASGQWDATGAAYVEGDTQIPCGEAILRCLRIGQDEFQKLRGSPAEVFWLPDVFGYSGCMPQLLRAVGVKSFYTTKLSWSSINRFPHSSFRWQGPDGSEVVAQVSLIHDYNEWVDVKRLRECALHHQQSAVHPEMLIPTGYGDGGGGPTEEMLERARRVSDLAGVPRVEWGNIEPYFERLGRIKDKLPAVVGELMLELHRGVFTTHGALKAAFRGLERALQTLEAAHVARGLGPIDLHYWKRASFSHFHDHIPGSSIWEVYAEAIPELQSLATKALAEARDALAGDADVRGWFNPLPLPRTWIDGDLCYALAPLSGAPAADLPRLAPPRPVAETGRLRSDRVLAEFDPEGSLVSLAVDGKSVAVTAFKLVAYPDQPAKFASWDVDRASIVSGRPARPASPPVASVSGLEASLTFEYTLAASSRVRLVYSVRATEPVLRVRCEVDLQDPFIWLKAVVSTGYRGSEARFGAPFGSVLRGQWPGYAREEAQWEVPGSRWAVVQDDSQHEGLGVITEAKYGFTAREGVIAVSLLRSCSITEANDHPEIRDTPNRPAHADLGRQTIELALGRYASDLPIQDQPAALADLLYTPCIPCGRHASAGLVSITGAASVAPAWAEPLEKGAWALRLHETLGRRGRVAIDTNKSIPLTRADAHGLPLGPSAGPGRSIEIKPYELVTLRFDSPDAA